MRWKSASCGALARTFSRSPFSSGQMRNTMTTGSAAQPEPQLSARGPVTVTKSLATVGLCCAGEWLARLNLCKSLAQADGRRLDRAAVEVLVVVGRDDRRTNYIDQIAAVEVAADEI